MGRGEEKLVDEGGVFLMARPDRDIIKIIGVGAGLVSEPLNSRVNGLVC